MRPVNPDVPPVCGDPAGSGPAWIERSPSESVVGEDEYGTDNVAVPLTMESENRVMKEPSVCSSSTDTVCGKIKDSSSIVMPTCD